MPPPAASGGPSALPTEANCARGAGAPLCGRDTAALAKRDALLNPRPVVPSPPPRPAGSQEGLLGQCAVPAPKATALQASFRQFSASRPGVAGLHPAGPPRAPEGLPSPAQAAASLCLLLAPRPRLGSRTLVPPPNSPHLLRAA